MSHRDGDCNHAIAETAPRLLIGWWHNVFDKLGSVTPNIPTAQCTSWRKCDDHSGSADAFIALVGFLITEAVTHMNLMFATQHVACSLFLLKQGMPHGLLRQGYTSNDACCNLGDNILLHTDMLSFLERLGQTTNMESKRVHKTQSNQNFMS